MARHKAHVLVIVVRIHAELFKTKGLIKLFILYKIPIWKIKKQEQNAKSGAELSVTYDQRQLTTKEKQKSSKTEKHSKLFNFYY